jgi:hypothetical protein
MKYTIMAVTAMLLVGCGGGGSSSDPDSSATHKSLDELKQSATTVVDSDGIEYQQVTIAENENIIVSAPKNADGISEFKLVSNSDSSSLAPEKLVVSGKLTIR